MWKPGTGPSALFRLFPIAGRTKRPAQPGKLHDHRGLRGARRPAHWPVIAWPPPSRWPGSEEGGAPVRKALPPLREAQLPQRSAGTFLIIVITTISGSGDNPVQALCSQLPLQAQPHGLAGARDGPSG